MQLCDIFIIKNHRGLYKVIDQVNDKMEVESLIDGQRMPLNDASEEALCLTDIELYGTDHNLHLNQVFKKMCETHAEPAELLQCDVKVVKDYFKHALPEIDQS